jgi:thymidylate kinase
VRQADLALARADPERIRVVDATGSPAAIKKIVEEEISDI